MVLAKSLYNLFDLILENACRLSKSSTDLENMTRLRNERNLKVSLKYIVLFNLSIIKIDNLKIYQNLTIYISFKGT